MSGINGLGQAGNVKPQGFDSWLKNINVEGTYKNKGVAGLSMLLNGLTKMTKGQYGPSSSLTDTQKDGIKKILNQIKNICTKDSASQEARALWRGAGETLGLLLVLPFSLVGCGKRPVIQGDTQAPADKSSPFSISATKQKVNDHNNAEKSEWDKVNAEIN